MWDRTFLGTITVATNLNEYEYVPNTFVIQFFLYN